MDPGAFDAAASTAKVFPYRLPGFTVFHDAPILAERRPNERIWVKLPVRVRGSAMFRNEAKTLPLQVFTGGMEIPANEVVGVRFYDLGGIVVYRQALILVQLANETDTNALTKIAEITGIGLTLGTGALAGLGVEASLAARVLLWADRAAFVLGTLAIGIKEHRGEIIAAYGEAGQNFLKAVDIVQSLTALYGFARVALQAPQAVTRLRDVWGRIRGGERGPVADVARDVDEVLAKADEIAAARRADAAGSGSKMPEGAARSGGPTPPPRAAPEAAQLPKETSPEASTPDTSAPTSAKPLSPEPTADQTPGSQGSDALSEQRRKLLEVLRLNRRRKELEFDAETGAVRFLESQAKVRLEQKLGRRLENSSELGVDVVDPMGYGPIQIKGPIPPRGSAQGLADAAVKDLTTKSAVKTLAVDLTGLSRADEAIVRSAVDAAAKRTGKRVIYLGD
jgi:hypothetical protein